MSKIKLTKKQRQTVTAAEKFLAGSTGLTLREVRAITVAELEDLWKYEGLPPVDVMWVDNKTKEEVLIWCLG